MVLTLNSRRGRRNWRAESFVEDDFISGAATSTLVGALGWVWGNTGGGTGTSAFVAPTDATRVGIFQRGTGTTIGSYAYTHVGGLNPLHASALFDATFSFRLGQTDADTLVRVGLTNSAASDPAGSGLWIEKSLADTNWFVNARAGTVDARTDAGVATGTDWVRARLRRVSGTHVGVSINDGAEIVVAWSPATTLAPFFGIRNGAAAEKTIQVDYFSLLVTGLAR